jgi:hypothetical protein
MNKRVRELLHNIPTLNDTEGNEDVAQEWLAALREAVDAPEDAGPLCTGTLVHSEFEACPVHDYKRKS